jgi:hypothetical protein
LVKTFSDNLTPEKETKMSNVNALADTRLVTSITVSNRSLPYKKALRGTTYLLHIYQNYLSRRHKQNVKSL